MDALSGVLCEPVAAASTTVPVRAGTGTTPAIVALLSAPSAVTQRRAAQVVANLTRVGTWLACQRCGMLWRRAHPPVHAVTGGETVCATFATTVGVITSLSHIIARTTAAKGVGQIHTSRPAADSNVIEAGEKACDCLVHFHGTSSGRAAYLGVCAGDPSVGPAIDIAGTTWAQDVLWGNVVVADTTK